MPSQQTTNYSFVLKCLAATFAAGALLTIIAAASASAALLTVGVAAVGITLTALFIGACFTGNMAPSRAVPCYPRTHFGYYGALYQPGDYDSNIWARCRQGHQQTSVNVHGHSSHGTGHTQTSAPQSGAKVHMHH